MLTWVARVLLLLLFYFIIIIIILLFIYLFIYLLFIIIIYKVQNGLCAVIPIIYISHSLSYNGYKLNSLLTYYHKGFISQLVEHRTGIVMGSYPIGIFSELSLQHS